MKFLLISTAGSSLVLCDEQIINTLERVNREKMLEPESKKGKTKRKYESKCAFLMNVFACKVKMRYSALKISFHFKILLSLSFSLTCRHRLSHFVPKITFHLLQPFIVIKSQNCPQHKLLFIFQVCIDCNVFARYKHEGFSMNQTYGYGVKENISWNLGAPMRKT